MTPYLELSVACDEVRWDDIIAGAEAIDIDHATLNKYYLEARSWAMDIIG